VVTVVAQAGGRLHARMTRTDNDHTVFHRSPNFLIPNSRPSLGRLAKWQLSDPAARPPLRVAPGMAVHQ
ncbi:hypothetical protein, partial [Mesorhizobium sp.]|uniref:hypothetical protein n=1 Tax=Mesorhizobium sp. TaxID=1871066 RepID=UPI00257A317A